MLDVKGGLTDKKPGQDAEQVQLKRTWKPVQLSKPDRGELPGMGLKALLPMGVEESIRGNSGHPGSGCPSA